MHGWYAAARVAGMKGLDGKLRLIGASAFLRSDPTGARAAFVPPVMEGVRFTQVVAAQPEGADGCLVRFSDINDAEMAQQLVGCTVLLEGDPPEGAQQDDALEVLRGFEVVDEVLGPVGVVESVDAGPDRFQPLMHVRRSHSAEDALIPLVEDLIVRIDEQEERIHMRLPSGLLDI